MPVPSGSEPEWVELWNAGSSAVQYDTLQMCDATGSLRSFQISLAPGKFAVLTKDTAALIASRALPPDVQLVFAQVPVLNNTYDCFVLKTTKGAVLDSFGYRFDIKKKGYSLERINPLLPVSEKNYTYSTSADSATCGYLNSVYNGAGVEENAAEQQICIAPNPLRKSDVSCRMKIKNNSENNEYVISIIDISGNKIKEINKSAVPGGEIELGNCLCGLPVGNYFIRVQTAAAAIAACKLVIIGD